MRRRRTVQREHRGNAWQEDIRLVEDLLEVHQSRFHYRELESLSFKSLCTHTMKHWNNHMQTHQQHVGQL